jgi:hypothetical protein
MHAGAAAGAGEGDELYDEALDDKARRLAGCAQASTR